MSRYTWLLDPGHGGIIDGVYQTAGKRSPIFPDGSVLYGRESQRLIRFTEKKEIVYTSLFTPMALEVEEILTRLRGFALFIIINPLVGRR